MTASARHFYERVKSHVLKDSDLPNLFVYHLTIELGQRAATVSEVRKCYEECDLHPPSWLASHFSSGLRSKPKRFIKANGGYRLENKLRERIAALFANEGSGSESAASSDQLAGIEYYGVPGGSKDCENAVMRLLQFGDVIKRAQILTASNRHCLLLTVNHGDLVAIKSGFASGYGGEGPRRFSRALQLLDTHGAEIEEREVDAALLERLDSAALRQSDIESIERAKQLRQWGEYIDSQDIDRSLDGTLWRDFPPVIPFAVIDSRIFDLALSFWGGPDDRLLKGYRRLEDLIRDRTSIDEHGSKLFSRAFSGDAPKLGWKDINDSERAGRANLFIGAYMAHRNPRAHRESKSYYLDAYLTEFLVLNHLFRLEREAVSF